MSASEELDLLALWGVVWRYRFLIAGITFLFAIAAVVLALLSKPVFRAEVVITEVRDTMDGTSSMMGRLGGLASLAGVNLTGNTPGRENKAFLQSRTLVEEFIKRHELLPQLFEGSAQRPTLWRGVKKFRDSVMSIRDDMRKGITTVSISWSDPETAARWANELVALVNELLRNRAKDQATRNIDYLSKQVAATQVVELQRVMYGLIESETKTLMLANVRVEYAFEVVDRAVAPEVRIKPQRTLMVAFGTVLGMLAGVVVAFVHNSLRGRKALGVPRG